METKVVKPKQETSVRITEPPAREAKRSTPTSPAAADPPTIVNDAMSTGPGSSRTGLQANRDKKIGHRRVDEAGQVTYKKKPTSELMAAIQLGIGQSITSLSTKPKRDLLLQDFSIVESVFFPREGSNLTPAHHYSDFLFKTYAPFAFRYFRELFGIQPDDFLLSLCNEPLQELSNPGASGSIFYITNDDEFIIKTVQHKEAEFLQKLLPGYYMNLNQNPRTLLPKFYGLYCYQCGGKNIRFVVMNNLLPSSITMHEKYDLKGSTYKRKASKREREKKSPTLKDLDFRSLHPDGIMLEAETHGALIKTIERDCRVLQSFKIMDYSLLVGVHNLDVASRMKLEKESEGEGGADGAEEHISSFSRGKSVRQRLAQYSTAMEAIQARSEPLELDNDDIPPGGIPARNSRGERLLLYMGVIDILQSYRLKKRLEHAMKAMVHDADTISVHRPGFYATRFQSFYAQSVFRKIPSFRVCTDHSLKHSPSKKKTTGNRQRSVSDHDSKPSDRSLLERGRSTSEAEAGAVGGRPDLLPANATPPRAYLESRNGQQWAYDRPEVVSTSPTYKEQPRGAGSSPYSSGGGMLGSPAPSHSESTPTHTEYTEGTPSFTASSASCSSDMLDSTPGGLSTRSVASRGASVASDLESGDDRVVVEFSSSVHKTSHIHNNSVTVTETSVTDGRTKTVTTSSVLKASDEASSQPEATQTQP